MYRPLQIILALICSFLILPSLISAQQPNPLKKGPIRLDSSAKAHIKKATGERPSDSAKLTSPMAADPFSLNDLAAKLTAQGELPESVEKLQEAIRLAPDLAGSHINLSIVYERLGKLEDALKYAQTGADLEPTKPRAYRQLCGVLFQLNRFGAASDCYHDLVKLTPDAESRTLLATALVRAGQNDRALEILGEVTKQTPLHARAHNSMGVALINKKKYKEAARSFKRAVEINPSSSLFRFNLGISQALNHNKAGALSQYRELQKLDPERARMIYKLIYRDKVVFVGKQNTPK